MQGKREGAHVCDVAHERELVLDWAARVRTVHLRDPHCAVVACAEIVDRRLNRSDVAGVCAQCATKSG